MARQFDSSPTQVSFRKPVGVCGLFHRLFCRHIATVRQAQRRPVIRERFSAALGTVVAVMVAAGAGVMLDAQDAIAAAEKSPERK